MQPAKSKYDVASFEDGDRPIADRALNILVVEDSESDLLLLQNMLESASGKNELNLDNAPRLSDAFRMVKAERYDLVLLDLNLLDIQGIACVAALHAEIPEIPIVVYSGMDDPRLFREAMLCGAHSYLVKGKESADHLKSVIDEAVASVR